MTNELTVLRFHANDGGVPPVAPEAVAAICQRAAELFGAACRSFGWSDSSVRFEFFVAPRQGSLELVFRHIFDMADTVGPVLDKEGWDALGNAAGVGSFLWVSLLGGNGVVDLFKQSAKAPVMPSQPEPLTELRLKLTDRLLVDREAQKHIRALLDSCILPGVRRVEIEVLDEPAVVLFGSHDRFQPKLLARGRRPGPNDLANQGIKEVTSKGGNVISGEYNNKPVRIFLGIGAKGPRGLAGETFVILWASRAAIPPPGGWVEVRAEAVNGQALEGLKLNEAVPFEFEEAEGVLLVNSASVWT